MSEQFIVTSQGLGKEISEFLIEKLGIPPHVQEFTVHFCNGAPISVTCVYLPVVKNNG